MQPMYVCGPDAVLRATNKASSRGAKLLLGARLNVDPAPTRGGYLKAESISSGSGCT